MAMNTSRDYLTEDVRHAISLAINRQVIVDQLLQGEARIAIGPLAEDHPYFDEKLLPIEYDPEKAKIHAGSCWLGQQPGAGSNGIYR